MGLRDIAPFIDHDVRERVMQETWGHLAPKKNKTYKGRIVWACGVFDSGDLNPTAIYFNLKELNSSPWSYLAINEFMQNQPKQFRKEGCIYEWTGTFRNYVFEGKVKQIFNANRRT